MSRFKSQPATTKDSPLQIALIGYTRSGKTYGSLLLARGIAGPKGRIGIIDTEGGRGSRYVGLPEIGEYQHIRFEPPFGPLAYIEAIQAAVADNWDVIIIDSASHAWDGEGGALEIAAEQERELKQGKKNGANWMKPKLEHGRFIREATERCPAHVICCFRTAPKTDFSKDGNPVSYEVISEKSAPFSFEFQGWLASDTHLCRWRVPKIFEDILPNGLITSEMGSAMVARNNGQEPPSPVEAITELLEKAGMGDADFADCLRALNMEVPGDSWTALSDKILSGLAKPDRWQKILAQFQQQQAA